MFQASQEVVSITVLTQEWGTFHPLDVLVYNSCQFQAALPVINEYVSCTPKRFPTFPLPFESSCRKKCEIF